MKMKQQAGFTLIEVVVVVVIMGIVMSIALPDLMAWSRSLKYKEAARTLASALRSARAQSVAENREYRLLIDVSGDGQVSGETMQPYQYAIQRGSQASNTTSYGEWTTVTEDNGGQVGRPLISRQGAINQLKLRGGNQCDGTADIVWQFNPNGTSDTRWACIMESDTVARWIVGIRTASSGRVTIARYTKK